MWAEFKTTGRQVPLMTSSEAADLFAYFYATLYFAPAGDPLRGQALFQNKGCAGCHSEVLDTRPANPFAGKWTELKDPITWAERMWNHAPEMVSATANRGVQWPRLSEQDMVDLLVFLGRLSDDSPQSGAFVIGEPEQGRPIFERTCESCHSFGQEDRSRVDLLDRARPRTVMGYTAAMWNHAPAMRNRGGSAALKINPGEMRDLIAFLFSQRYFFEQGDAGRGRNVYQQKGCATCHETRRTQIGAPDLSRVTEEYSPITLTSALWRHGPAMLDAMREQGLTWPEFRRAEMTDLIAYLNSRLVVRIAR
jgi:cytochrome c551/c552